jgi:hypothetical protein
MSADCPADTSSADILIATKGKRMRHLTEIPPRVWGIPFQASRGLIPLCSGSIHRRSVKVRLAGAPALVMLLVAIEGAGSAVSGAPVYLPGIGHYYDFVEFDTSQATRTWWDAKAIADSMEFLGVRGHLAVITFER